MKKILFLKLVFLLNSFSCQCMAAAFPTDVVGRNLSVPGASWAGHVGVVTANSINDAGDYVVEALWEPVVLQINTLNNFMSRSPYWGAKYGVNQNNHTGVRIILEGAFQTSLKCATYTLTADYRPGQGQWGLPSLCPKFRCDTFVNYLYAWGGYQLPTYNPPGRADRSTIPLYVFNAFPAYRPINYAPLITEVSPTIPLRVYSINSATIEELEALTMQEFQQSVDLPLQEISKKGQENIFNYSDNPKLNRQKRLFLLDKLSFIVSPSMLPQLIERFGNYAEDEELSSMIIQITQDLYQENQLLLKQPKYRKQLKIFYKDLLDNPLSNRNLPIVIRGFIALSNNKTIIQNKNKLDNLLLSNQIDKGVILSLKNQIAFKSKKLGKQYFKEIINDLIKEKNSELDTYFYGAIASKLGENINLVDNQSKLFMQRHLDSILLNLNSLESRYKKPNILLPQSQGIFVEAYALTSTSSLEEACRYIENSIARKNLQEKENILIGLSNNNYLKSLKSDLEKMIN